MHLTRSKCWTKKKKALYHKSKIYFQMHEIHFEIQNKCICVVFLFSFLFYLISKACENKKIIKWAFPQLSADISIQSLWFFHFQLWLFHIRCCAGANEMNSIWSLHFGRTSGGGTRVKEARMRERLFLFHL